MGVVLKMGVVIKLCVVRNDCNYYIHMNGLQIHYDERN